MGEGNVRARNPYSFLNPWEVSFAPFLFKEKEGAYHSFRLLNPWEVSFAPFPFKEKEEAYHSFQPAMSAISTATPSSAAVTMPRMPSFLTLTLAKNATAITNSHAP